MCGFSYESKTAPLTKAGSQARFVSTAAFPPLKNKTKWQKQRHHHPIKKNTEGGRFFSCSSPRVVNNAGM